MTTKKKSVRLTNSLRDEIRDIAIDKAFKTRKEEVVTLRRTLVDAIVAHVWDGKEKIAAKLPKDFFPQVSSICVNIGGASANMYCNGERYFGQSGPTPDRCVKVPYSLESRNEIRFNGTSPIYDAWADIVAIQGELDSELVKLRNTLDSVLAKSTTVKALIAQWPEIEEILPERIKNPTIEGEVMLPALTLTELNSTIGLPVAKAA